MSDGSINKKAELATHFSINLIGYFCSHISGNPRPLSSDEIQWVEISSIKNFAFPKSTNKLFELIMDKNWNIFQV